VEDGRVAVAGRVESEAAKERVRKDAMATGATFVDLSNVRVLDQIAGAEGPLQELSRTGRDSNDRQYQPLKKVESER
jgi:hypothetical protein